MREFKFRCWIVLREEMIYNDQISLTEGEVFERVYSEETGYMNSFERKQSILMQCTGLQDMDGCDIYEGDILSNGAHINWIVIFHDGSFKVKSTNQMNKDMWILNQSKASAREVIENIFENEDLVNVW